MLKISRSQLEAMSEHCSKNFEQRAVMHIRQAHAKQCEGRDDATIAKYVEALIKFARANKVVDQGHVLRLIDAQMVTAFSIATLTSYQRFRLKQAGIDEATRVHNFELALQARSNPVVISVSTDLAALERQGV